MRNACIVLLGIATACAPVLLEDGFRQGALARGCRTEDECDALMSDAKSRAVGCDTQGHVSCAAAGEDYNAASGFQDRMRHEVQVKRQLEAQAQDRRGSASVQRLVDDEQAKERARGEATSRERSHANAVTLCVHDGGQDACGSDEACKLECADERAKHLARVFAAGRAHCIDQVVDSNGAKKTCTFVDAFAPVERQAECDKACVDVGRKKIAYFRTHAKCCDNTRSPSCTYGNLRSGCCSHHDGVCAEDEPQ